MAKLLITTQVFENYAWNEDGSLGTGDNAYWKPKGGNDYVVRNFKDIVADDYLTQFERDQLEFEGEIRFPAKELVW